MPILKEKQNAQYTDYIICAPYFFNATAYPTYPSGAGYLMPWWSVPCLYSEGLNVPYFYIEDVFMGGFVADRCLVPRQHNPGFTPDPKLSTKVDPKFDVLIHYMFHEEKFDMHKVMTRP